MLSFILIDTCNSMFMKTILAVFHNYTLSECIQMNYLFMESFNSMSECILDLKPGVKNELEANFCIVHQMVTLLP